METTLDHCEITVWKNNASEQVNVLLEFEYIEAFGEVTLYCVHPDLTIDGIDDIEEDIRWCVGNYLNKRIRTIHWVNNI